ncbi:MAG: WXG100 family type VII secretion target [Lachnospiraceae bacterium]|nr:WXG100 family type VII secretion target [Lachnospiraceae bacterium]
MAFFCVTSSRLRAGAEELTQLNSRFQAATEELDGTETALKGMWEGSANDAFHAAFIRDRGQMDAFHEAIVHYVQALLTIAAKYEEAEARNTQIAGTRNY